MPNNIRSFVAAIIALVLLALMPSSVFALQPNVENRLLTTAQGFFISDAVFSPDGQSVFYLDQVSGGSSTELFHLSLNGGVPTVISPSLVAGGSIIDFQITPDGQSIVYRADQINDNVFELFMMPITGGSSTRLNPALSGNNDVRDFLISSDGSYVIYAQTGSLFSNPDDDIFSVELSSDNVVNLTADLGSDFPRVDRATISIDPSNRRVVFHTFGSNFARNGIFSVQLNGQSLTQLNSPDDVVIDTGVIGINDASFITPDGDHVIYSVFVNNLAAIQLFRVPIDGSETRVAISNRTNSDNGFFDLSLTPDGQFLVGQSQQLSSTGDFEVLKVPVFAEQNIERISQALDSGFDADDPIISPDGRFVLYEVRGNSNERLFLVSIDGGNATQINNLNDGEGFLSNDEFGFTPDGQFVLLNRFVGNGSDMTSQVFAVPINGSEVLVLSDQVIDNNDNGFDITVSADSSQVLLVSPDGDQLLFAELSLQAPFCFVIPNNNNGRFVPICL